jgi:hypothetical protein
MGTGFGGAYACLILAIAADNSYHVLLNSYLIGEGRQRRRVLSGCCQPESVAGAEGRRLLS